MLTTAALSQAGPGVRVSFINSLTKFSTFKKDYTMPHPTTKVSKYTRKQNIKKNSVYLARELLAAEEIPAERLFKPDKPHQWEHLADAVNLTFVSFRATASRPLAFGLSGKGAAAQGTSS